MGFLNWFPRIEAARPVLDAGVSLVSSEPDRLVVCVPRGHSADDIRLVLAHRAAPSSGYAWEERGVRGSCPTRATHQHALMLLVPEAPKDYAA